MMRDKAIALLKIILAEGSKINLTDPESQFRWIKWVNEVDTALSPFPEEQKRLESYSIFALDTLRERHQSAGHILQLALRSHDFDVTKCESFRYKRLMGKYH